MGKETKTNAMRILDRLKISYEHFSYECKNFESGQETAKQLSLPFEEVYKTLVAKGGKDYFVYVIPISGELDMKKASKAVGEKSVELIHVKDINSVTGYVRGGCTAIGMKKQYRTVIDKSAEALEFIYVSAGRIGCQIKLNPKDLKKAVNAEFGDITKG